LERDYENFVSVKRNIRNRLEIGRYRRVSRISLTVHVYERDNKPPAREIGRRNCSRKFRVGNGLAERTVERLSNASARRPGDEKRSFGLFEFRSRVPINLPLGSTANIVPNATYSRRTCTEIAVVITYITRYKRVSDIVPRPSWLRSVSWLNRGGCGTGDRSLKRPSSSRSKNKGTVVPSTVRRWWSL